MSWENLWSQTSRASDEELDLRPGEVVLKRESGVIAGDGTRLEEVVLTNRDLILSDYEKSGPLTLELVNRHYPLRNLIGDDGEPEVYVTKTRRGYAVTLVFAGQTVILRFGIGRKSTQEAWAGEIAGEAAKQPGGSRETSSKQGPLVTRRCMGCGAPITGRQGQAVTCEYCGTQQTL